MNFTSGTKDFNQLSQLQATLNKTLEESMKLGNVDLKEIEETMNMDSMLGDQEQLDGERPYKKHGFLQLTNMVSVIDEQLKDLQMSQVDPEEGRQAYSELVVDDQIDLQIQNSEEPNENIENIKQNDDQAMLKNHFL